MATYTALKQSFTPSAVVSSDGSQQLMGLSFKVTSANMQFDGWWLYCDIAGGQESAAEDFALWQVTGAGAGTYISGSVVTSGTLVQGWNFIPASSPIALTNGQEYRAVRTVNKAGTGTRPYNFTSHLFDTGSAATGAVNGPLTVFSAPGNATNPEPSGDGQQVFTTANPSNNATTGYPSGQFNQAWYGMDVQVSDVGGGGGGGTSGGGATGGLLVGVP